MDKLESLYSEYILELNRRPLNKRKLIGISSAQHRDTNPLCGDSIEIQVKIVDGKIDDACYEGEGCAISQAAASLLTEMIRNFNIEMALRIQIDSLLQEMRLPELRENPARIKCAALPLKALKMALYKYLGKRSDL